MNRATHADPWPTPSAEQTLVSPGRSCPLHYRYRPETFARAADPNLAGLETLYVVGGLYGNELALQQVLALFERERAEKKRLVFNGDFHWFDIDPAVFAQVQRTVLSHVALRGNVETELASGSGSRSASGPSVDDAGCGCAYPDWVGDEVVERSNLILNRLQGAVSAAQRQALAKLPMLARADVGHFRLSIVHGDAESLAGWGFAQEHLRDVAHRQAARAWLQRADVDAFACSHTCLPVFQGLRLAPGAPLRWVLNNGAAGMPNFSGDSAGLLTRVALTPFDGPERRCGVRVRGLGNRSVHGPQGTPDVHVDAIAIDTEPARWQASFLRQWPPGSDAHASYFQRIAQGPNYRLDELIRQED